MVLEPNSSEAVGEVFVGMNVEKLKVASRAKGAKGVRKVPRRVFFASSKVLLNRDSENDCGDETGKRFRRCLTIFLSATVMVGGLIPLVHLPELSREQAERMPVRLAKVIVKQAVSPKPIPEKPKLAQVIKPKPAPEKPPEIVRKEPDLSSVEKPLPPRIPPKIKPQASPLAVQKAREKAAKVGVFAAQDVLADMRKTLTTVASQPVKRRVTTEGNTINTTQTDSAVLAAKAKSTSGGLRGPVMMRMTQGNNTFSKSDERVEIIEGDTSAGLALREADAGKNASVRSRNEAAIRKVFDQHKGAIDALYRRALRQDPSIQGRVMIEVVIEPTGEISQCRIVSSELGDKKLENRLLSRIRLIQFGTDNVNRQTVQYAFEFVPS